jgi:hypothetical protein
MIIIVTTISVYLSVYKGVAMDEDTGEPEERKKLFGKRRSKKQPVPEAALPPAPTPDVL